MPRVPVKAGSAKHTGKETVLMKRFQLLTTAIFLFCTLLIAGCTGRGVEAQATPAPEATPTATTDVKSGIQTGDSEVNKILAGTCGPLSARMPTKSRMTAVSARILPDADTGAKTATDIKEPGTIRELAFRGRRHGHLYGRRRRGAGL